MSEDRKDVRGLVFSVKMYEAYVRMIPRIQNFCLPKILSKVRARLKKLPKCQKSSLKDNSSLSRFIKRQYSSAGSKRDSFDNSDSRGPSLSSLNSQGRKKNQQRQSSNKYPLKKFHKY